MYPLPVQLHFQSRFFFLLYISYILGITGMCGAKAGVSPPQQRLLVRKISTQFIRQWDEPLKNKSMNMIAPTSGRRQWHLLCSARRKGTQVTRNACQGSRAVYWGIWKPYVWGKFSSVKSHLRAGSWLFWNKTFITRRMNVLAFVVHNIYCAFIMPVVDQSCLEIQPNR